MYLLLTLFFSSLIGIIIMIGRKLATVQNREMLEADLSHPFLPDLQKIKHLTIISLKKYGHIGIIIMLRLHIRSTNFLKNKYEILKTRIKNLYNKNYSSHDLLEKTQVSNFLKTISDYKRKIKAIKHRIREEEKNL